MLKAKAEQSSYSMEILIKNLCTVITSNNDSDLMDQLTGSILRLLSNYNEFNPSISDEFSLIEKMKKKMYDSGKFDEVIHISSLYRKLKQFKTIKNISSILHFLLAASERNTLKEKGSFKNGILTSTPASNTISFETKSLSNTWKISDKTGFSSIHTESLPVSSISKQFFSHTKRSKPLTVKEPGRNLSSSRLTQKAKISSDEKTDELDVVRQMLFVFQGIESKDIKLSHRENAFCISTDVRINKRDKQLVHRLCELGWLHNRIKKFVESKKRDTTFGLVGQAFCASLEQELVEYYRLLAKLQTQLQAIDDIDDVVSLLTLQKLVVWTSEPMDRLKWAASLVDSCKDKRGGCLATVVHSFMQTGDPNARSITRRIMRIVSQPLLQVINRWIYNGELYDPFQEFFVSANPSVEIEQLWNEKYQLKAKMVPSFVPLQQAHKILLVGKSINFLRLVCGDRAALLRNQSIHEKLVQPFFDQDFDLTTDLILRINKAYEETSSHLLYVLNHKYKLKNHLFTLRKFFLLGQGDFARHLLDSLRSDLNKPAKNLSRHDLQGAFGCAIQNFNLQSEADHLLLLDFRILQHNKGDLGWNVFTLDCHAQPPLSTIITPQVKNVYMQVFMFLWRSKRVEHNLIEVWKKSMEFTRRLSVLTELKGVLHQCHSLTAEMWNFVHQFQYYIAFEVLECSWADLQETLTEAKDFNGIIKAHQDFLQTLMCRCLLDKPSSVLLKEIRCIFSEILKFEVLQSQVFEKANTELKLRNLYERRKIEQEAKGVWGDDEATETLERKRRRDFCKITISGMRAELVLCANAYQEMVIKFLDELSRTKDGNLRNLSWRLDFNECYKQRQIRKK